MVSRRIALLALCLAFPAPGCCTLARLFCGPDDSEWVQISFRTPQGALATFKEAVRRDNCYVVYDSLGEDLKTRMDLGLLEACVAWEKLKDEYTGLHLLGYAEDTELTSSATRASYELEVSGYRFRVDLVRQQYWAILTTVPNAPEISDFGAFGDHVRRLSGAALYEALEQIGWEPRAAPTENVQVLVLPDPQDYSREMLGIEDLDLDQDEIIELRFSREWKVDSFSPMEDTD